VEVYFDDERVTLGDGSVDVDQGVHGVQKVAGSRAFVRDPRLSPLVRGRPGASRAERTHVSLHMPGTKWCSEADHWEPRDYFSEDSRYADGKKPICKLCSARLERRRYALMREAEGHIVKPYGERKRA
jgi:hypothetical protein